MIFLLFSIYTILPIDSDNMVGTRSTRNQAKEPKREPLRERTLSYDNPNALGDAGEDKAARRK